MLFYSSYLAFGGAYHALRRPYNVSESPNMYSDGHTYTMLSDVPTSTMLSEDPTMVSNGHAMLLEGPTNYDALSGSYHAFRTHD